MDLPRDILPSWDPGLGGSDRSPPLHGGRGAGLSLFRLNAESHPDDASAQYHLGEAYRFTGQPEEAARQYRRTLDLDPEFPQAAQRLEMVTGG